MMSTYGVHDAVLRRKRVNTMNDEQTVERLNEYLEGEETEAFRELFIEMHPYDQAVYFRSNPIAIA